MTQPHWETYREMMEALKIHMEGHKLNSPGIQTNLQDMIKYIETSLKDMIKYIKTQEIAK